MGSVADLSFSVGSGTFGAGSGVPLFLYAAANQSKPSKSPSPVGAQLRTAW
jgi:hypothetical protein